MIQQTLTEIPVSAAHFQVSSLSGANLTMLSSISTFITSALKGSDVAAILWLSASVPLQNATPRTLSFPTRHTETYVTSNIHTMSVFLCFT